MKDSILGGLYGIAIGDALGAPVEFLNPKTISFRYKKIENYQSGFLGIPFFLRFKGHVTDDTKLSLAVLKGIVKDAKTPYPYIGKEFINFRNQFPLFIGNNLLFVFWLFNGDWERTSKLVDKILHGRTAGNGALMRSLPVALCYPDYETMISVTKKQAIMTHWNPLSTETCVIYNTIAYYLLNGISLKESILKATKDTPFFNVSKKPDCPPNGYSVYSLQWVLYWLYCTDSFEEAIISAVNNGIDADTIASLVGGLAGIYYGFSSIPKKWVKELRIRENFEKLSESILSIRNSERN